MPATVDQPATLVKKKPKPENKVTPITIMMVNVFDSVIDFNKATLVKEPVAINALVLISSLVCWSIICPCNIST